MTTLLVASSGAGVYAAFDNGYISINPDPEGSPDSRAAASTSTNQPESMSSRPTSSPEPSPKRQTTSRPGTETLSKPVEYERVARFNYKICNDIRFERDIPRFSFNEDLARVAQNYAEEMAIQGFLSHTSPDGVTLKERLKNGEVDCSYSGENIAQTWWKRTIDTKDGEAYYDDAKSLAEGLTNQWMNSKEHRKNILRERWNSIGVGVAITSSGRVYAVQNFCA